MVAPNSPSALAKHSTMPAITPGSASGSVTVRNTQARLAPSVAAASSSRRSIASNDSRIARTSSGNAITPQASAAPVQRNENTMPNVSARNAPIGAAAAERDQQQIAGHHRRQHQRQMHDAVEQRLAPEVLARQQPGDRDAERQRHHRRHQRDAQRQADRGPFFGGEVEHHSLAGRARATGPASGSRVSSVSCFPPEPRTTRAEVRALQSSRRRPDQEGEAIGLEDRLGGRRAQEREIARRPRAWRRSSPRPDRTIGGCESVGKRADDLHARLDLGVGLVDDAERRLAARHQASAARTFSAMRELVLGAPAQAPSVSSAALA